MGFVARLDEPGLGGPPTRDTLARGTAGGGVLSVKAASPSRIRSDESEMVAT